MGIIKHSITVMEWQGANVEIGHGLPARSGRVERL